MVQAVQLDPLFLAFLADLGCPGVQLVQGTLVVLDFLLGQIVPSAHLFQAFLVDQADPVDLELHSHPSSLGHLVHLQLVLGDLVDQIDLLVPLDPEDQVLQLVLAFLVAHAVLVLPHYL